MMSLQPTNAQVSSTHVGTWWCAWNLCKLWSETVCRKDGRWPRLRADKECQNKRLVHHGWPASRLVDLALTQNRCAHVGYIADTGLRVDTMAASRGIAEGASLQSAFGQYSLEKAQGAVPNPLESKAAIISAWNGLLVHLPLGQPSAFDHTHTWTCLLLNAVNFLECMLALQNRHSTKHMDLLGHFALKLTFPRWWFQIFLIFTPNLGEMIQFGSYFSAGLVQPPTSFPFPSKGAILVGPAYFLWAWVSNCVSSKVSVLKLVFVIGIGR